MNDGRVIRFLVGAAIIGVSAFMFAFAIFGSAQAQTTWTEMDMGGGWTHYSSSDGATGYSMPMGKGWRYYSFSDDTAEYEKDWSDWSNTGRTYQAPQPLPSGSSGWGWDD